MYKIALCDDDTFFYVYFEHLLSKLLSNKAISYKLDYYPTTTSLEIAIRQGTFYDLIFLDILIDLDNGIDFARQIRTLDQNVNIIFVSSSSDYALNCYDLAPLHYLVKPFNIEKLETALNRFFEKYNVPKLCFQIPGEIHAIEISDILYFEVYSHKVHLKKTNGETISFLSSLREVEEFLPLMTFMRSHKSYIVNMQYISNIVRYKITLTSGENIPVSKGRYLGVQNRFIEYARQKSPDYR